MTSPLWTTVYIVLVLDGSPLGPGDDSPHYAGELGRDPEWRVVAFVERGGAP